MSLQSSAKDIIIEAYDDVEVVRTQLATVRHDITDRHKSWMEEAKNMGQSVGEDIEPKIPRRASSTEPVTAEDHFRKTVSIPFLDNVALMSWDIWSQGFPE